MSAFFDSIDPGDPAQFPVGSRVRVAEPMVDHHFFRSDTGTVVRVADRRYLGVIVRLDKPFRCDHGHWQHVVEDFNFSASDLEAIR